MGSRKTFKAWSFGTIAVEAWSALPPKRQDTLAASVWRHLIDGTPVDCEGDAVQSMIENECARLNTVSPELSAIRANAGAKGAAVTNQTKAAKVGKNGNLPNLPNLPNATANAANAATSKKEIDEEIEKEKKTDGIEPAPPVEPSGASVLKSSISSPSPAVGLSPFSAVDDPVEVALTVCGVWDDGNRRCFGARLKECGRPAFLATVELFKSELEAGEAVRNKAAALNARLRAASGAARPTPPQEPPAPQQTPAAPVSRPSMPRPAPATAWAQGIAREVFARNPAANWDALQEAAWNWATDNANGRGLTQAEQEALLNAWEALDAKRQREAPDDPPGELPPAVAGIVARLAGKVDSVHPAQQSKSVEFEFVQRYLSDNPTATFHEVERAAERELTEKYSLDEIENAFLELEQ